MYYEGEDARTSQNINADYIYFNSQTNESDGRSTFHLGQISLFRTNNNHYSFTNPYEEEYKAYKEAIADQ